jgi:hypothetical protein
LCCQLGKPKKNEFARNLLPYVRKQREDILQRKIQKEEERRESGDKVNAQNWKKFLDEFPKRKFIEISCEKLKTKIDFKNALKVLYEDMIEFRNNAYFCLLSNATVLPEGLDEILGPYANVLFMITSENPSLVETSSKKVYLPISFPGEYSFAEITEKVKIENINPSDAEQFTQFLYTFSNGEEELLNPALQIIQQSQKKTP